MQEPSTPSELTNTHVFEPTLPLVPMGVGEHIIQTSKLFMRTAGRVGLVAVLLLIPAFLFAGAMLRNFLSTLIGLVNKYGLPEQGSPPEVMNAYGGLVAPLLFVFAGYVVLLFIAIYVQTLATVVNWNEAEPRHTNFGDIIRTALGRPYLLNLVQSLLVLTILFVSMIAASLISTGFAAILTSVIGKVVTAVFACAFLYFVISTIFRVHEIVADERGPWRGLISSMSLVRLYWARTAAYVIILVILCIAISYGANSLVMGTTAKDFAATAGTEPKAIAQQYQQMLLVFTTPYFIVQAVLASLFLTFGISYLTVLYGDLRARRGDFVLDGDEHLPPAGLPA